MTMACDFPSVIRITADRSRGAAAGRRIRESVAVSTTGQAGRGRLTARGRVAALAALLLAVFAMLSVLAATALAGPAAHPTSGGAASAGVQRSVVVHRGDTLWSIASRVAANRDPRAEVDALLRVNGLVNPGISPGQTLLLP